MEHRRPIARVGDQVLTPWGQEPVAGIAWMEFKGEPARWVYLVSDRWFREREVVGWQIDWLEIKERQKS